MGGRFLIPTRSIRGIQSMDVHGGRSPLFIHVHHCSSKQNSAGFPQVGLCPNHGRCDCKPKGMRSRPAQKWDIPCLSLFCIGPRSFRLSQVESEEDRMLICSSARISRNSAHVPEAGTCLVCSVHVWHMSRVKSLFWSRQAWSHVVSSVFWKTLRLSAVIQLSP